MECFGTWGGECFGYRPGDYLFTHDGRRRRALWRPLVDSRAGQM